MDVVNIQVHHINICKVTSYGAKKQEPPGWSWVGLFRIGRCVFSTPFDKSSHWKYD
jgi:hypothetical protein